MSPVQIVWFAHTRGHGRAARNTTYRRCSQVARRPCSSGRSLHLLPAAENVGRPYLFELVANADDIERDAITTMR